LEHDILQQTVETLVPFLVQLIKSRGYRTATIGECLGDDPKNWYRDVTTGEAVGPARDYSYNFTGTIACNPPGTVSTDGTCGPDFGGLVCPLGLWYL
jgi:hypothetical protein